MKICNKRPLSVAVASVVLVATAPIIFANPELVKDLTPGPYGSIIDQLEIVNNELQFTANTDGKLYFDRRYSLGETGDTFNVIQSTPEDHSFGSFKLGDQIVFVSGSQYAPEIWVENADISRELIFQPDVYDNNRVGTTGRIDSPELAAPIYPEGGKIMVELVRYMYSDSNNFVAKFDLVSIDPVAKTVAMIREDYERPEAVGGRFTWFYNGKRYWTSNINGYGEELWRDAGLTAENILVADINSGAKSSYISDVVEMNGVLYFQANGQGGRELWKMDSSENVSKVAEINPGGSAFTFDQYYREQYHIFNDELYFLAQHQDYGLELWKTDGLAAGTTLVGETAPGVAGAVRFNPWLPYHDQYQYNMIIRDFDDFRVGYNHGDGFYYRLILESSGLSTLWFTNGTSAGTRKIMDEPGVAMGRFGINEAFLVIYRDANGTYDLWRVDDESAAAPEIILSDVDELAFVESSVDEVNGTALLRVVEGNKVNLWKTDGTIGGTEFIKKVANNNWVYTDPMISVGKIGSNVLFVAYNNDTGRELWTTDGTPAGTHLLVDIAIGPTSGFRDEKGEVTSRHTAVLDGLYYFQANDDIHGQQMWVTDGSTEGTHMWDPIFDAYQDEYSSTLGMPNPNDFVTFNGSYYFVANSDEYGKELFRYKPDAPTPPATSTGALGDYVWEDTNGDGIQDVSEFGREGVTVQLQTCTGDFVAATVTDSMGAFRFDNVAEDYFQLQFMLPTGYEFSPEKATREYQKDSNADPTTGVTPCYDMTTGYKRMAVDAGMVPVASSTGEGAMGDYVWEDTNGDGVQDTNENGLEGIAVNLLNCSGAEVATTITDSSGSYLFEHIGNGDYRLEFELPAGFSFSPEKSTDQFKLDSNADETTGLTPCYNMDQGWKRRAIDVGMIPDGFGSGSDTLTVVKAIYFSSEQKLWLRVSSDAEFGTSNLTASAEIDGANELLGLVGWKSAKGFYQANFKNLSGVPTSITLTSDLGGSVTTEVEIY